MNILTIRFKSKKRLVDQVFSYNEHLTNNRKRYGLKRKYYLLTFLILLITEIIIAIYIYT